MQWGTWAGLLTAFFTMITAIGGAIATIKVLVPNLRVNEDTHRIVNQQRTDMVQYQKRLIALLKHHDIEVPDDQSSL